jgi:tetratricopeptide (TPR) repeat protein
MGERPEHERISRALVALRAGRVDEAARLGDDIIAKWPNAAAARLLAAGIAFEQGRYVDAERWAVACLRVQPAHVPALMLAARAATAAKRDARAVDYLRRAAELAPSEWEVVFRLCLAQIARADPTASETLETLSARFPAAAAGWAQLGRAMAAAPAAFRDALAFLPRTPEAILPLARALRQTGAFAEARARLLHLVAAGPDNGEAYFLLGLVCEDLRDEAGALAAYRRGADLRPELPEIHLNLGIALQRAGDLEGAMQSYRRAIRLRPDTFGRVAQAIPAARKGELWLDLRKLRQSLAS